MRESAAPLLVGPNNAEAVVGLPWRRVREAATRLGLRPRRLGVAYLFDARELVAALEREPEPAPGEPALVDPAELIRRSLGKRRRAGVEAKR